MALVLIAEDHRDHQKVIVEVARRLGCTTMVADDGAAALTAAGEQRPDLLIADLDMPKMNGVQLCRAFRGDPLLADVPVVLVTALSPHDQARIGSCASMATVQKPFDITELSDVIAAHLAVTAGESGRPPSAPGPRVADVLLSCVDAGLTACDTTGRLTFYNDDLSDFFGTHGAGIPLANWPERFGLRTHDGRPLRPEQLPMARALSGESVRQAGILATDRLGRQRWLTLNARPVRDEHGEIIGAAAAVHDVTAGHLSHVYENCKTAVLEALAGGVSAVAARRQAVNAVGTGLNWPYVRLWLRDPVTDRLHCDATYAAPGEPPVPLPDSFAVGEGLAGHCWQAGKLVWVPDIHDAGSPVVPQIRAATTFRAAGAVPITAGGQVTGVMTFFSRNPQQPEPGLAVLLTGIAGHIGSHLQQHRADDLARHLAAVTDDYVALAGHEIRTPLTTVTAYAQLIAEMPELSDDVREMVGVMERNSRKLRQLFDQLLDLAGLDSGHLMLADGPVDLAAVLREAIDDVQETAAVRGVTVVTPVVDDLLVRGDGARLRQAVTHLIDNAVKFSPDNAEVSVRLTRDDGAALLTVADTGVGLPTNPTVDLFRRLYRGDNARHTDVPGNGLGLALCRTVVERHRGTITLTSNRPRGTVATVRLPRHDA
ncbi:hypothetical protein Aab01nite_81250 [Paractinoplanes abujensis]|uniref:histidine kinase n=1 Tax=Paractinoplanes abujensis TaxID=882441 RepID=A0A7W7CRF0_9ACTN|nr:ATP-binding protein [Actinoplanes abujensis]MBB4693332.1 signal transduction histidine kinase/PAS domain-containing protein [Actinoplanes abujensis]GID24535.1 hypothetical protein Aab01nite_81250 [Actinoplanes abujensis]